MQYRMLGPVCVSDESGTYSIGAQKIEALLILLLINPGQVVPIDQIMTEIWNDRPPRRAVASLHVHVSKLRKFLSRPASVDSEIITRTPGYTISLGSDQVDYHMFLRLADKGRGHVRENEDQQAADCLERALALWRGPILDRMSPGPIVEGFVTWLTEVRTECTELLIDARLNLGEHRELVGQLYSLTATHPLREVFYQQLMVALYRSDRKADALAVYGKARRTLQDELGLEPGRTLQELQHAILTDSEASIRHGFDRRIKVGA